MRKLLALSICDQGLLSASNFTLNMLLIRLWPPNLFGLFGTALAVSLICLSVQYSTVSTQLSVLRPASSGTPDETALLSALWSANCILTAVLSVLVGVGALFFWQDGGISFAAAMATYVGSMLMREYTRSLLFAESAPSAVLQLDILFVAISVVGFSLLCALTDVLPTGALSVLAFGNAAACLPFLLRKQAHTRFSWDANTRDRYGEVWRDQSRWALLGAVLYEATSRAHVFVVGTWFGIAATGILQAGEMLLRPLGLLVQAWERIALPRFSQLAREARIGNAHALAKRSLMLLLIAAAIFLGLLASLWPWLNAHIFRQGYANIGLVVALWSAVAIVKLGSQVISVELQGFSRFRELSTIGLATSAAALTFLITVTLLSGTYEYSILAILAGNLVGIALSLYTLGRIGQNARSENPILAKMNHSLRFDLPRFFARQPGGRKPGDKRIHVDDADRDNVDNSVAGLVSVCVCTYRRPHLTHTLNSILAQRCPEGISCEIVVVDNDSGGFAGTIVEDVTGSAAVTVRYVIQPNKGLSSVRNTAIDNARGEWIAFIDDDEVAEPNWLIELVKCAQRFGADGVVGRVMPDYDKTTPEWVRHSGFFDRELSETGTPIDMGEALSGNALLRASFLNRHALRFHSAFNATGGEDTEFFQNFLDSGGNLVSSREAVVRECIPPERAVNSYLTQRSLCVGEIYAKVMYRNGGSLKASVVAVRALANIAGATVLMFVALPRGPKSYYRYYLILARNVGKLRYLCGCQPIRMYD